MHVWWLVQCSRNFGIWVVLITRPNDISVGDGLSCSTSELKTKKEFFLLQACFPAPLSRIVFAWFIRNN